MREKFDPQVEIYTDGSKITMPEVSCSAGMIVIYGESTRMTNYKLPSEMEILGCELFAIKQALAYIIANLYNISGYIYGFTQQHPNNSK